MKAITVEPMKPDSARFEDVAEPDVREGSVLVAAIAVGVCGTDVEIVEGKYGWAPQGATRLVLGHESLGRVIDPGPRSSLKKGDLVVGIVRRPDPIPCPNCAVGEWDMCRNPELPLEQVKELHFQVRPCEWGEFRNVALHPKQPLIVTGAMAFGPVEERTVEGAVSGKSAIDLDTGTLHRGPDGLKDAKALQDWMQTTGVAEASTNAFRTLTQARVLNGHEAWGPMALADARLILRDLNRMICLDVAGK